MMKKKVVVIGAGPCGLNAAEILCDNSVDTVILEKKEYAGGLCGGEIHKGLLYEYGPHSLHANDYSVIEKYVTSVGNDIVKYLRKIKIKFRGTYFNYPLKITNIIFKLGTGYLVKSIILWLYNFFHFIIFQRKIRSSEDLLKLFYGPLVYHTFFKEYSHKVWGIPLAEMSYVFAKQRIPMLDTLKIFKKIYEKFMRHIFSAKNFKIEKYKEIVSGYLFHTKKGHRYFFTKQLERIKEKNGNIIFNTEIKNIEKTDNGRLLINYRVNNEELSQECDDIISTIPITSLIKYTESPPGIVAASRKLRYRSLVVFGLLIKKEPVLPCMFIYYRNSLYNRVTDLYHFGVEYTPEGSTIVLFEVTCDIDTELWKTPEKFNEILVSDIAKDEICKKEDIVEINHLRYEFAYPIYDLNFKENYNILSDHIRNNYAKIHLTGRQGLFKFVNTHIAVLLGEKCAYKVLNK